MAGKARRARRARLAKNANGASGGQRVEVRFCFVVGCSRTGGCLVSLKKKNSEQDLLATLCFSDQIPTHNQTHMSKKRKLFEEESFPTFFPGDISDEEGILDYLKNIPDERIKEFLQKTLHRDTLHDYDQFQKRSYCITAFLKRILGLSDRDENVWDDLWIIITRQFDIYKVDERESADGSESANYKRVMSEIIGLLHRRIATDIANGGLNVRGKDRIMNHETMDLIDMVLNLSCDKPKREWFKVADVQMYIGWMSQIIGEYIARKTNGEDLPEFLKVIVKIAGNLASCEKHADATLMMLPLMGLMIDICDRAGEEVDILYSFDCFVLGHPKAAEMTQHVLAPFLKALRAGSSFNPKGRMAIPRGMTREACRIQLERTEAKLPSTRIL